jgi:hypothetical protein
MGAARRKKHCGGAGVMPQIPALFQPWPPEEETEEYDVIFLPNENFETNQLHGVNDMDETTYTYDDGSTYTYHDDGSVTVTDASGETYAGINTITSDGSAQTTYVDNKKLGFPVTTTVNPKTGTATQVTTGTDVNGIVGIINSVTKVVQAVKGTGNIAGSNIFSQPIGTAIPQANGTVITRNANGTITTFDPRTGQTSTTTLPGQAGGLLSGNNLLIIGVLAIGAIALSKRK